MNRRHHITAFYIEALILILAFVGIILVLTQVFGAGRVLSSEADQLTRAVGLAQNMAEAAASADRPAELKALIDEEGNTSWLSDQEDGILAYYDPEGRPADSPGTFHVVTLWESEPKGSGELTRYQIFVFYRNHTEPVYELETAVYREGGFE